MDNDPVEMFLGAIDQMLEQGVVHLHHAREIAEEDKKSPAVIGYYDSDWLYLFPSESYQRAVEFYRQRKMVFTCNSKALKVKLKERGMLQTFTSEQFRYKLNYKLSAGTYGTVWVLKIGRGAIENMPFFSLGGAYT